jgi:hypothetical protein
MTKTDSSRNNFNDKRIQAGIPRTDSPFLQSGLITTQFSHFLHRSSHDYVTRGTSFCFSVAASYVKLCKKSDANFDACVISSVEALRPRLNKGKGQRQRTAPSKVLPRSRQSLRIPLHLLDPFLYTAESTTDHRPEPVQSSPSTSKLMSLRSVSVCLAVAFFFWLLRV